MSSSMPNYYWLRSSRMILSCMILTLAIEKGSCFMTRQSNYNHVASEQRNILSSITLVSKQEYPLPATTNLWCSISNLNKKIGKASSVQLFMSTSSSSKYDVLYQKVVRPSRGPSAEFLGLVVEYLQSYFKVPTDLPMPYETITTEDDVNHDFSILSIESPLSDGTRMEVEVIGIYPDGDKSQYPTMAMVALKKRKDQNSDNGSMVSGLFQASEQKIAQALEQGLNDFIDGKIPIATTTSKPTTPSELTPDQIWELEDHFEEFDANEKYIHQTDNHDVVIDTTASSVTEQDSSSQPSVPKKGGKSNTRSKRENKSEDFAVQMAAKIATQKLKKKEQKAPAKKEQDGGGDFAVQAAQKLASSRKKKNAEITNTLKPKKSNKSEQAPEKVQKKQRPQPQLETPNKPKFRISISKPSDFKSQQQKKEKPKQTSTSQRVREINIVNSRSEPTMKGDAEKQKQFDNLMFSDSHSDKEDVNNKKGTKTKTNEEIEKDIMKAAMELMPDGPDQGGDMTPQELLDDVLKFGEEKEKEEKVGSGFVEGVYQKSKELLKDEHNQNEAKRKRQRVDTMFKEPSSPNPVGIHDLWADPTETKPLSAEEELKRIFAAGENIAEGRMVASPQNANSALDDISTELSEQQIVNDEYIDNLIEAENTVSPNVMSLDDELAELEVRINRSPDESLGDNAMFDVFSGPEVYNPNVDPATAVNWPGALPGTRNDIRLPPQLKDAVEQAQYASNIMTQIEEVQVDGEKTRFYIVNGDNKKELDQKQVYKIRKCVEEAVAVGLIPDPLEYLAEKTRLSMVLDELTWQPEERFEEIASNYKDLLLSDNFVALIKERLQNMAKLDRDALKQGKELSELDPQHKVERQNMGRLISYAQLLLKEARALGAELEASHLEVIRSICQVAMNPSHKTEEETSEALTDAVRDMRPLFDESFVAYLKYAIAEEQAKLARAGLLDDPEHNRWLFVLKIVQEGVYAELSVGVSRYIDHIWYVLRMESKSERRMLLSKLIDVMPTMDVRPFIKVVDNIVASLGSGSKGEFDTFVIGGMTNKLLQLRRDVQELLPPDRVKEMSKDADDWVIRQREKLAQQRKITKQRLKAAEETGTYEDNPRIKGEVERMT